MNISLQQPPYGTPVINPDGKMNAAWVKFFQAFYILLIQAATEADDQTKGPVL